MEAIEIIEKYIEGKLRGEALSQFEDRLKTDDNLRQEVEEFKTLISEIQKASEKSFAAKVQEWETKAQLLEKAETVSKEPITLTSSTARRAKADSTPEPASGPGFHWVYAAVPAAAAVITLLVIWVFPMFSEPDPAALYAESFTPYPDLYTNMGEVQDERQAAIAPYNVQDYTSAVNAFESFISKYPEDKIAKLYLSIALMESGESKKAVNTLDNFIAEGAGNYQEAAEWYKALAHLKAGELEQSKTQLHAVLGVEDHSFTNQAKRLLGELE